MVKKRCLYNTEYNLSPKMLFYPEIQKNPNHLRHHFSMSKYAVNINMSYNIIDIIHIEY